MSKRLYVVAGEPSGDLHGAGLLQALRGMVPGLEIHGAGGPAMATWAGPKFTNWTADAAVMGVWEVLKHYGWFKRQFTRMLGELRECRPEVLLLIDYPGFNLRFAAAARREFPAMRIVHYICPQVWAWHKSRIPKMAGFLNEVLCLFPFEPPIFQNTPLRATFVGHPLVDELEHELLENTAREDRLVGLFPGSREREVASLFPMMIESARLLREWNGDLKFRVPAATPAIAAQIRSLLTAANADRWLQVTDGGSHRLMRQATCAVIASGTATLEAACLGTPYTLVYRVAPLTYFLAKRLVKIPHIGLVNILAGKEVVEELIQSAANPPRVAESLRKFLESPENRLALQDRLAETASMLGGPGAHHRAAAAVAAHF